MAYVDQLLAKGERAILTAHRHPLFLVSRVALLIFLTILLWVLSFAAWRFVPTIGGILGLVLLAGSFIPLVMSVYRFLWWRMERYIITSYRIIQIEGIVNRRTFDSALEKVNDVETEQSVFGRMFNFGTISIITGSEIGVNELVGIARPYDFKRALLEAKLVFGPNRGDGFSISQAEFLDDEPENDEGSNRGRASQPDEPTRRFETVKDDADPSRIAIALTELRNAGVITDEEFSERMRRVTRS